MFSQAFMKRHWSQIVGLPLTCENQVLAVLTGVFLDPEQGKVLAYRAGFQGVFSPLDIQSWHAKSIELHDPDALTSPEEISRLKAFGLRRSLLNHKKVSTQGGKSLGRLYDFCLETSTSSLISIEVSKRFLFWEWDHRLFPFSDIQEITEKEIILKVEPEQKAKIKTKQTVKANIRLSPVSSFEKH
ncbi:PRC-barrel domain-containing protein [Candidatus Peregrinibacteria bacterium]|nr:MAG: PRC-barrel domain-containing protein [Candidatus Peregrinibacteria bacterium]